MTPEPDPIDGVVFNLQNLRDLQFICEVAAGRFLSNSERFWAERAANYARLIGVHINQIESQPPQGSDEPR